MENVGSMITMMFDQNEVKNTLEARYTEAMKDSNFQLFTKQFNLSDEILMRYTSKLQEALNEQVNCKQCMGLFECKNKVHGHLIHLFKLQNRIDFEYSPCKYQQIVNEENESAKRVYFKNIPNELRSARLKDVFLDDMSRKLVIKSIIEFINAYKEKKQPKGIFLHGSFGSGKTYLLAAMANELAKDKINSAIIYYPELLLSLKSSFNDDFYEQITYVREVPVLILDDLGAENVTPWSRDEILGPILQYRMQEKLPTFITSNFTLEELTYHFSNQGKEMVKAGRIMERIRFLCEDLQLISESKRK